MCVTASVRLHTVYILYEHNSNIHARRAPKHLDCLLWELGFPYQHTHHWPLALAVKASQCLEGPAGTDGYSGGGAQLDVMTHENDKHVHLSHGSVETQMFQSSASKRFAEHSNLMSRMTENKQGVFWTWRQSGPGICWWCIQSTGWTRLDERKRWDFLLTISQDVVGKLKCMYKGWRKTQKIAF